MAKTTPCWMGLCWLSGLPRLVQAAVPLDSTRGHRQFSLGLQATRFSAAGFVAATPSGEPTVFQGLFPTLGGQLAPRWRVELGAWGRREVAPETTETDVNGGIYRYASTSTCFVLPLLVRFSLFPHLRHGRVEALAGFVGFHTRTQTQLSYTPAGQSLRPLVPASSSEYNDGPLLLGLGATYELTRHWSVRVEASVNWSFTSSLLSTALGGPAAAWQPGYGGGLHYTFAFPRRPRH
jgi:hypothetical protein